MAITNHERVGKSMELLRQGLAPFVEREIKTLSDIEARALISRLAAEERIPSSRPMSQWDVAAFLKLMWEAW